MKKTFSTIFILLSSIFTFSQNISYTAGQAFVNKNGAFKSIIGEDRTSFYVLRLGTKGAGIQNNIEKYDKKTFQLEWIKNVAFEDDLGNIPSGDDFLKSTAILSGGKIYFFLSLLETRKNTRSVYVKTLLTDNGNITGPAQLLAKEEDYKGTMKLVLSFSPDTSKVLIKYPFVFSKRRGLTTNFVRAGFDSYKNVKLIDLKNNHELYSKDMPVSDSKGDIFCTSVQTDNKGNLLCIYSHLSEEKDILGTLTAFNAVKPGIGKIPMGSTVMNGFDLNIGVNDHAYLTTNVLQYQENFDYAVITGIFIDERCKGKGCNRREGNFFMKVDLDTPKVISSEYQYFDENTHQKYKELLEGREDYSKLYCFGSFIDKANEDVYSVSMGFKETIFVTRFDKSGKVIWTRVLPKNSIVTVPGIAYAYKNGSLYFVYLDNRKNMEDVDINNFSVKKLKGMVTADGANIIGISVNKEGELKRTLLGNNKRGEANFLSQTIDDLTDGAPVYYLKNGNKEQFVRFDFGK